MDQGCQLLVWPDVKVKGSIWKGTLRISDCTISNKIKQAHFPRHSILRMHWKGIMEFRQEWLAAPYKDENAWTDDLLTSLIGES